MAHPLWTGQNTDGVWYSLRSDLTCWHYTSGAWSQITTQTVIDSTLWLAVAQGATAATMANNGFSLAACESGGSPPPPPP